VTAFLTQFRTFSWTIKLTDTGIPIGFWRSVGASQNGFFLESFIDEIAVAERRIPTSCDGACSRNRRGTSLHWRLRRKSGLGRAAALRIDFAACRGEFVFRLRAQVIEISVNRNARTLKVHRVVCALDCRAHREPWEHRCAGQEFRRVRFDGGAPSAITIDRGRVQQKNFNDYQVLRIHEMPVVDVHIHSQRKRRRQAPVNSRCRRLPGAMQCDIRGDRKARPAATDSPGKTWSDPGMICPRWLGEIPSETSPTLLLYFRTVVRQPLLHA